MYINIPDILKKGDGISVAFKRAKNKLPKNLFDTVCAFLNRNGGTILLGVADNVTIEGIDADAVQQNSTPDLFQKQVNIALQSIANKPDELKILFLKSWNEWAEGNYMEPNLKFVKGYINSLKKELEK